MTKDFVFWFLMFLVLLSGIGGAWCPEGPWANRVRTGFSLILFLILLVLGLQVFGSPLK